MRPPEEGFRRVALVTAGYEHGGGVAAVVDFLFDTLQAAGGYRPEIVDLATSRADDLSLRLGRPLTWAGYPRTRQTRRDGRVIRRVGAVATEFEFQRYRPRRVLTRLLADYDLVQVVAGTPAWAATVAAARRPVFLQVATRAVWERQAILDQTRGAAGFWLKWMTRCTDRADHRGVARADAILTENRRMQSWIRGAFPRKRVLLAPPGIDVAQFSSADHRAPLILAVGRLGDPRKNFGLLVEAFADVAPSRPDFRLLLAGHGTLSDSTRAIIDRCPVRDRITVQSNVSRSELLQWYGSAAVFVLPSLEEGLGIAALEAMAGGAAVVATACGGPETFIRDEENGLLVPVADRGALRAALGRLLASPELTHRLASAGRRTVERDYSMATAGRTFLELYAESAGHL